MSGIEGLSDKILGAIITAVIGLVVWAIQRWLEPGARLGYWIPHDYIFEVPLLNQQPNQPNSMRIQTSTLTVQNLGRKAAEDVEATFVTRLDHFQLHPRRDYQTQAAADGTFTITINSLGPKEVLQIQLLSHMTVPVLVGVRSKSGPAKSIPFQVVRLYPRWFLLALRGCVFVGAFAVLYWIVRAVLFISRANGML